MWLERILSVHITLDGKRTKFNHNYLIIQPCVYKASMQRRKKDTRSSMLAYQFIAFHFSVCNTQLGVMTYIFSVKSMGVQYIWIWTWTGVHTLELWSGFDCIGCVLSCLFSYKMLRHTIPYFIYHKYT